MLASAMGLVTPSWATPGRRENRTMSDPSFRVALPPALGDDLQQRLARTRWSDAVTVDWRYGMDKAFLQALVLYWRDH